jgi:hypothetical protein
MKSQDTRPTAIISLPSHNEAWVIAPVSFSNYQDNKEGWDL